MERESPKSPWPAFSCVAAGVFMATLDSSVVHVALPAIRTDLGASLAVVEWVPNAYLIVITGLLLAFGRLADLLGQRRVYRWGLGVFTAGSGLCALAPGAGALVAARVVQGTGAAMLMACSPAIITAVFPPEHRGRGLGLVGTTVAAGLTAGPAVGGVLLGVWGWRSLFAVNLPLGIAAWLWAGRVLPPLRFQKGREGFDRLGAALLTAGLVGVVLAVNRLGVWGVGAPRLWALTSGAGAALAAFVWRQRRAPWPLVDLGLFRNRSFSAAVTAAVLAYLAGFVAVFLLPFYLADLRGLSPRAMGLVLTVPPLVMSLVAPWAGGLSDRIGYGRLTAVGLAVRSVSLFGLMLLGARTPMPGLVLALGLLGAGSALFSPPNTSSIMGSVPPERLGVAGGVAAVARNLGMVLGIAVAGAVFRSVAGDPAEVAPARFVAGWRAAMAAGLAACLLALVVSLTRGRDPRRGEARFTPTQPAPAGRPNSEPEHAVPTS
ncbi:MFS transporter [Deferrisoma camini]|uniref:MFS transporter n=1 Tax=Deferrisoma camini TaxID=1035120 RepID=UPI00046D6D7B|nr:MFS transporter [Deferrisoma camini]